MPEIVTDPCEMRAFPPEIDAWPAGHPYASVVPFPHWATCQPGLPRAPRCSRSGRRCSCRKQSAAYGKQAEQVDLQRQQLDDQRHLSGKQGDVLELQAQELRESLAERQREAAERRRAQAAQVFITEKPAERARIRFTTDRGPGPAGPPGITATVHNTSCQPAYDTEFRWHLGTAGSASRILAGGDGHARRRGEPNAHLPRGVERGRHRCRSAVP